MYILLLVLLSHGQGKEEGWVFVTEAIGGHVCGRVLGPIHYSGEVGQR